MKRPNFIVILIDDLRYDEFGAGGHPYMKTPHIDRLAHAPIRDKLHHDLKLLVAEAVGL